MIKETVGNLFEAKAEALVNAVNQRRRNGQRNRVAVRDKSFPPSISIITNSRVKKANWQSERFTFLS